MFPLLSVPKVNLFSSSTFLCRFIPSSQYPALSFLLKLPTSTNFEVFRFFVFQVDTIAELFEGVFLHPFFVRGHTSSTACILYNLKQIF